MGAQPRVRSCWAAAAAQTHSPRQNTCFWRARGSQLMPSARVFGPWPEHSNPAASCLQWSCALQAEAVDTFFFFACAHLTRGRCCTSDLIAPGETFSLQAGDSYCLKLDEPHSSKNTSPTSAAS